MPIRFNRFPGGRQKALALSYDDGSIHDRRLVQILNESGLKGTFHLNSGFLGQDGILSPDEIALLYRGHEISAHSVNHPHLTRLSANQVTYEIQSDRKRLESLIGYPVRGMSYPFGDWDNELLVRLSGQGMEYARTVESHGHFHIPKEWMRWQPTCHHRDGLSEKFCEFIAYDPWIEMALFLIWGHSFEFHRQNNWDVIEQFAKEAANHADRIWFATCMEIVDYANALAQARVSVDGNLIMNLSFQTIWLEVEQRVTSIAPGKILNVADFVS